MTELLLEKIEKIVMPFLNEMQVDLVDLHVNRYRGNLTIQILADKPMGEITIGECSLLNRRISEALERENFMAQDYTLEVSSPGLDRPLRTAKDFKRVIGREVRFYLSEPVGERLEYTGCIKRLEEENVVVNADEKEIILPLGKINKGIQVI